MILKRSVAAYGSAEFKSVLEDELNEHTESLPLEDACEHGGFPDPSDVHVYEVSSISSDDDYIYARISVAFTEECNTSCSSVTVPFSHNLDCDVEIDRLTGEAEFEVVEEEHLEEF